MNPDRARAVIRGAGTRTTTCLGTRTSILGKEEHVTLDDADRLTHVLSVGPTGVGKSQALLHVALQDAHKGRGLCLINPKGGLIDEFLAKLPEERWDDVVYLNPARDTMPAINVLEPHTNSRMTRAQQENQTEIIVADLIDLFRRQSEHWGDRFGRVLETLLRAHLTLNVRRDEANTLVDVYRAVINPSVLTALIDRTPDPVVREQLVRVKEDLSSYELEPLQRRLNDFMMNSTIRRVIGGDTSAVDFQAVVNQGKLLLVDVQKGALGSTVSELVGSLAITKVWAAAQSRVTRPVAERPPFYLFVDELQHYGGEGSNFATILAEAREYGLGCWLATQYLHQLDATLRRSVTTNCRTTICFNPSGSEDRTRLAGLLQGLDTRTLTRLGEFQAAVQTPPDHAQTNAVVCRTYPPWPADASHVDQLKQRQTPRTSAGDLGIAPSVGTGTNSGGETHHHLLTTAKAHLEDRGFEVDLLYQDAGATKPDGHVHLPDGSLAHLEAEHATLSKPAKVLANLHRAADQDRKCIFVVEAGNADRLHRIVADPVNRQGTRHEDAAGSYSYYTAADGTPITDVDWADTADYRILEVTGDGLHEYKGGEAQPADSSTDRAEPQGADLREIDRAVLRAIQDGHDDTHRITSATGYPNHKVNYSFEKLAARGLIQVGEPHPVERVTSGQKRVFEVKPVALTETGEGYVESDNN